MIAFLLFCIGLYTTASLLIGLILTIMVFVDYTTRLSVREHLFSVLIFAAIWPGLIFSLFSDSRK